MHAMPKGLNGIKLDLNEFDMNDILTKVKLDFELAALRLWIYLIQIF